MEKIIPIFFIFIGESLAIYAEIIAAKGISTFFDSFWKMTGLMFIAGVFLIAGYMFGMKYLQNIWIVGAISIASIVVVEPLVTYLIFEELPTRGPMIGLILGVLAIISALFIK
ncbi:MAG: hypothetical protein NTV03_01310 [Candidatus Nomurabacteria bacterium]|nr:hypothetical protein [Candidatus Nomurabacteria bacterium]